MALERNLTASAAQAGFTLLEVMAAFVIAALASLVLYEAAFTGAAQGSTAACYEEAVVRAQSRLASIGPITSLIPTQTSGDDGGGFKWRLQITAEAANGQGMTLYDVQVTESFGQRSVTLTTKRLGPTT
jgi:general secretion pathway protein I